MQLTAAKLSHVNTDCRTLSFFIMENGGRSDINEHITSKFARLHSVLCNKTQRVTKDQMKVGIITMPVTERQSLVLLHNYYIISSGHLNPAATATFKLPAPFCKDDKLSILPPPPLCSPPWKQLHLSPVQIKFFFLMTHWVEKRFLFWHLTVPGFLI